MRSFRKLILHANISGKGGNCFVLDTSTILTVTVGTKNMSIKEIDIATIRQHSIPEDTFLREHDYDLVSSFISLNEYVKNVVTYMTGYVVRMMQQPNLT